MQRHGIGQQVQRSPSGSIPHDRVTIPQMGSSRSLALDRPRQSALRYPAVLSNRANIYRVRRQPAPIHAPLRSRTTSAIAPPTISHSARGTQIPITHAAPSDVSLPAVSSLGGLRTPARCPRHHLHGAGIRKPSHFRTHAVQQKPAFRGLVAGLGQCSERRRATGVNFCKVPAANADALAGKRTQDVDRCSKVPRIMPLLELL